MRIRTVARLVLFLALALAMTNPVPAAASSPPHWEAPVIIDPELPLSWFPDLFADASGAFHLVYSGNLSSDPVAATDAHTLTSPVMYTQLEQQDWVQPADIAVTDAGIVTRPLIVTDTRYAHIVFRAGVGGNDYLYYMHASLGTDMRNAHSWSTPVLLSNTKSYYAQVTILADGTIVVVYNQLTVSTSPATPGTAASPTATSLVFGTEILARHSTDGGNTWSFPVHVSATPERAARTSLAMAPDGHTLIAAWDEGYDNMTGQGDPVGAGTAVSTDGGATWGDRQELRSSRGPFEQAVVTFGASGPLLVYRSIKQPELLYRQSSDNGHHWGEEGVIPGAIARPYSNKQNFDKLSLAADGDGRLLLSYVGQDNHAPGGLGVFIATFAGDNWTTPVEIAAPAGYPEYPRIAVALGNRMQVVYFVRNKEYESGHYTLWSVAGHSDARAIAPVSPPAANAAPFAQPTLPPVQIQPYPTVPAPAALTAEHRRWLESPQAEVNGPAVAAFKVALPGLALILFITGAVRRLRGRQI